MRSVVDKSRIFALNENVVGDGPVVYWMSRDQRAHDNWALLYAQEIAAEKKQSLAVVFSLVPNFLEATIRQYEFMLQGLEELERQLGEYDIPFYLLLGDPVAQVTQFVKEKGAGALVTEFDPLHVKKKWQSQVAKMLSCAMFEVDAHNIVPCRVASPKQEFGAYTLRPKIQKLLSQYLTDFPSLKKQVVSPLVNKPVDWQAARKSLQVIQTVSPVDWCVSGEQAAKQALKNFIHARLPTYESSRNDPTKDGQSNLSPYLHFGQISAQRVALTVRKSGAVHASVQAFLEELIIRRELSDNFCFYNSNYDSVEGFPAWAKKTLAEHAKDPREYVYELAEFELACTHDPLWNAAQIQMVQTGKMYGYMRMYWAKKILEWTRDVEEALRIAIYLNDKYELDGRDPNGYVGVAWSIGGVHDRAWFDRPVFGKIRYMNYRGCKSKFDVDAYIEQFKT